MATFSPVAARIHALQDPMNHLHYNRRECQQLVDHIKAFIASLEEKSYMPVQDLLDLQQKLFEALTDLYDVLTDIREQPQLKQILWRDGISILVSRVYEILDATSFNAVEELDLILRKNEGALARSLDVGHFHDIIRTAQDDQILKLLGVPRNQLSQAIIALHQRIRKIPNDSNPERQFLNRAIICAVQTLKAGFIPAPQDAFSMTEFDIVIYHNRELGKGGFGEVFEGNWHGTKVAIKRIRNIHPALGANEINIMKGLKHDHVLQIFGANLLNTNQLFLVCALKSQGDVCTFLLKNPSANRRKLCYDVSLGLVYLHENSVIHGDIKPQNILIDENGIPCLCDFGLSRIRTLFTHAPTTPLDEERTPIGTFEYMSPEQMVYGTTNEASDVYSFGMTIYEIFSGDIPFKNISCWSLLRSNVVNSANRPAKPQPQADLDHGFDDKIWSLIEECWSQEPSNRPTAATVYLRLGDVNGCPAKPAEMYKKEIADLTAELARVKERSETARQEFETELAKLRDSLARREREQEKLKKGLDEEKELRNRLETEEDELGAQSLEIALANYKNEIAEMATVNESNIAARRELEKELAGLRDSLARREREQEKLKKDLNEERELRKRPETEADELRAQSLEQIQPLSKVEQTMKLGKYDNTTREAIDRALLLFCRRFDFGITTIAELEYALRGI